MVMSYSEILKIQNFIPYSYYFRETLNAWQPNNDRSYSENHEKGEGSIQSFLLDHA